MDGFKSLPKMAHFREGGSVKTKPYCGGGKAMKSGGDVTQDKAMIKKAFKQHDRAEHDKEPTEIKLKTGGRSKKASGTVRKFKVGGSVNNVYEAKKSSGDKDNIKKVKDIKPGKAKAPSGAKGGPNKYADGGEVIDMRDNKSNSIGDDVRARAMKFLETGKKDSDESPKTMRKSAPKSSKPSAKDYSDQNDRRSKQVGYEASANQKRLKEYDKPLEESHPEDYVTPGGVLKGMLKGVVRSSEKAAAKAAEKKAAERAEKQAAKEAKDSTRRDAEGYSPEEAVRKIDEPARATRTESSGAMKGTFKPEEIREGFKKGGKIKKMQAGSLTGKLSDYVMGTPAQNEKAKQDMARYLKAKQMQQAAGKQMGAGENMAMGLAGLGQGTSAQMPSVDQMSNPTGMPMQKRGGRVGKK